MDKENFSLISSIRAINAVADEIPEICLDFNKEKKEVIKIGYQPTWVTEYLDPLLIPFT